MQRVSKSELKARMFEFFREVERAGAPLIVTDYGKPVLQISPYVETKETADLFADLRGKVKIPRAIALASTADEWTDP